MGAKNVALKVMGGMDEILEVREVGEGKVLGANDFKRGKVRGRKTW